MSDNRIVDQKVDIDTETVHAFFDNRVNKQLFHRYNLVNYQDNNPELALMRDRAEKKKILPYLSVKPESRILDIGCGVGRWGDELVLTLGDSGKYVGVDYSRNLVEIAKRSADEDNTNDRRQYFLGSFQQIVKVLEENNVPYPFDIIIVNGVMVYINDADIKACLENITSLVKENSIIYLKESVGVKCRYTLKDVYSEELTSNYNAIYRSVSEYRDLFDEYFKGYSLISEGETFSEGGLNNRKETTSYYWIFKVCG